MKTCLSSLVLGTAERASQSARTSNPKACQVSHHLFKSAPPKQSQFPSLQNLLPVPFLPQLLFLQNNILPDSREPAKPGGIFKSSFPHATHIQLIIHPADFTVCSALTPSSSFPCQYPGSGSI